MIDCIASYHLNPWTCGIAKFNRRLAEVLSVPIVPLVGPWLARHPLVSINPAELSPEDRSRCVFPPVYDLFLHGFDAEDALALSVLRGAQRVFAGNRAILSAVRVRRPDAILAWCPSTIPVSAAPDPADRVVVTCGMAHKLDAQRYRRLARLLEATGQPYRLDVSTALHERTPWAETLPALETEMAAVFGPRVRLLGTLSDAALSQALTQAHALAAFFPEGARANNTTIWAALEHGCPVITNLDSRSPSAFVHGSTVFNIDELDEWPTDHACQHVRVHGWAMLTAYGWTQLAQVVRGTL